jgi:hypothetical protein
LANVNFGRSQFAGADFSAADLRNAGNIRDLAPALSRNTILSDGRIRGLATGADDTLNVRDYDPTPSGRSIPIRVEDRMIIGTDARLRLFFEADPWDSTISFQPNIPVDLGGSLELAFAKGADPARQIGRTFKLFDWTGVTPNGRFEVVSDYQWNTANLYSTGEVKMIPEPATWLMAVCALILVAASCVAAKRRNGH